MKPPALLLAAALAAALRPCGAGGVPAAGDEPAAATVVFTVTVPPDTPVGEPVHLAGDFQGWNPGDPEGRLEELPDGRRRLALELTPGQRIEFKFTRGSWGTVEKGPAGEEIANRSCTAPGEAGASVELKLAVAKWRDLSAEPPRPSTATGDLTTRSVPGFLDGRPVRVWLPPGYHDEAGRRFPVLYMLDGQNVFDAATSFAGEWGVDETCAELIAARRIAPLIVVAVDNGGDRRTFEYTPWEDGAGRGGGGGQHLAAIAGSLKPWVDRNYRTLTDAAHTGIAGSSLGGLMVLHAGWARPDVFGLVAAVSPSFWWADRHVLAWAAAAGKPAIRLYVDMGTDEGRPAAPVSADGADPNIAGLRAMEQIALEQGFVPGGDLLVVEEPGGRHHESSWRARFPRALEFLFPPVPGQQ